MLKLFSRVLLLLILLLLSGGAASAGSVLPKSKVKGFFATIKKTTSRAGASVSWVENSFARYGNNIRYSNGADEYVIFDINMGKKFKVFPKDKIFFESRINESFIAGKARAGELEFLASPNIEVRRIKLMERELNGKKCDMVLVVRNTKHNNAGLKKADLKKKKSEAGVTVYEYTLRWELKELDNVVIRSEFIHTDYTRTMVEYLHPEFREVDESYFHPPADFSSLTPF